MHNKAQVNQEKIDAIVRARAKTAYEYFLLFKSPAGSKILDDLNEQFYNIQTFVPGDPYGTHVNEGGRMVMKHINNLIKEGETHGD